MIAPKIQILRNFASFHSNFGVDITCSREYLLPKLMLRGLLYSKPKVKTPPILIQEAPFALGE
jgi:hypothetical protein